MQAEPPPHKGSNHTSEILTTVYSQLLEEYGPQRWWPTYSGGLWEIMLGAVLTQHTNWTNVEIALNNILSLWGARGLLEPQLVLQAPDETLTALLRRAGYHTAKTRKVRNLAQFVIDSGGVEALFFSEEPTETLREKLLGIWGIGPETADAILLYALNRPIFVADAYALRLASRWGLLAPSANYAQIQALFMDNLPHDVALFNEYHALIVAHGKGYCRPRPRCEHCPLAKTLRINPQGTTWSCPRMNILTTQEKDQE